MSNQSRNFLVLYAFMSLLGCGGEPCPTQEPAPPAAAVEPPECPPLDFGHAELCQVDTHRGEVSAIGYQCDEMGRILVITAEARYLSLDYGQTFRCDRQAACPIDAPAVIAFCRPPV